MTHEQLRNPFKEGRPTPETPTDEQVVGGVLGAEAVRAMRELRGSGGLKTVLKESPDFEVTDLGLTDAEREVAKEAEGGPRQEMFEWAGTFLKNEKWVDKNFTFHPDGRIESIESIFDLAYLGVTSIPPVFVRVEGLRRIHLEGNEISTIENLPEGLETLDLSDNKISIIENLPAGLSWLWLKNNPLTSIDDLPPRDKIGKIIFSPDQQAFADQAKQRGYTVEVR